MDIFKLWIDQVYVEHEIDKDEEEVFRSIEKEYLNNINTLITTYEKFIKAHKLKK